MIIIIIIIMIIIMIITMKFMIMIIMMIMMMMMMLMMTMMMNTRKAERGRRRVYLGRGAVGSGQAGLRHARQLRELRCCWWRRLLVLGQPRDRGVDPGLHGLGRTGFARVDAARVAGVRVAGARVAVPAAVPRGRGGLAPGLLQAEAGGGLPSDQGVGVSGLA